MPSARTLPASKPIGGSCTTAQILAIDLAASNAAVGTNTTDTIAAQWTFSSTARWTVQSGFIGTFASGSTLNLDGTTNVGDGSNPATFRVKAAATLQVDAAATETHANIVQITGAGALLKTASGGRIQLADGDYPTFSAPRTKTIVFQLSAMQLNMPTGWVTSDTITLNGPSGPGLVGGGANASLIIPLLPYVTQNGSLLVSLTLYFTPLSNALGRTGGSTPAAAPQLLLLRRQVVGGAALPAWTTRATITYGIVSAGDYGNGQVKAVVLAAGETIDTTTPFEYAIQITDETGAGATTGNRYHHVVMTYTATDMAPA